MQINVYRHGSMHTNLQQLMRCDVKGSTLSPECMRASTSGAGGRASVEQHVLQWLAARPHRTQRPAVRVIGCDGSASMLDVVKALEWVHGSLQAPAAVLMSLGGPATAILDAAAQSLTDIGVTVVVAGGNSAGGQAA